MLGGDAIGWVLLGALAGGMVNGLTGMGTGITAMGLWLHVLPPTVAASLVIICSVVAQLQTLPMIWREIELRRVLPFVLPGLAGVPIGTWLLPRIDPASFKLVVGLILVAFAGFGLLSKARAGSRVGGIAADGIAGFGGGILGGIAGFSGVVMAVWTDVRGWAKAERRSVLQAFNLSILAAALASHAIGGLLTPAVGWATLAALPGTLGGAWIGAYIYRRLGDRGYQRTVLLLLLASGCALVWTSR